MCECVSDLYTNRQRGGKPTNRNKGNVTQINRQKDRKRVGKTAGERILNMEI